MADLNGAGNGTLGGLSATGSGQAQWWRPTVVTANGSSVPSITPIIFVKQDAFDGGSASVQMQVSASDTFGTTLYDTTTTQGSGTAVGRQITGLSDETTYYVRARVSKTQPSGYVYTSAWSPVSTFRVSVGHGRAYLYATLNVGVENTPKQQWAAYAYENVGVEVTRSQSWPAYAYENVGIEQTPVDNWAVYVYEGDVNTATPPPVIWFIQPASARAGDGVQIIGWGFGDLQETFSGVLELDYGPPIGWVSVPIVSWQTFPAQPNAYGPSRLLDQINSLIDMQHTIIEITVPGDALPPGYPVRVRTDGP